jgi:hypothetical protein
LLTLLLQKIGAIRMATVLKTWPLSFPRDLDVRSAQLQGGEVIPLPPRKLWNGDATGTATLFEENGKQYYYVVLSKDTGSRGKTSSSHEVSEWLKDVGPGKLAEAGIRNVGIRVLGGAIGVGGALIGAVAAGIATLVVPKNVAKESFWQTEVRKGVPVTVVLLGF